MKEVEELNQMQQKVDSYHSIMYALDDLLWKLKDKELKELVYIFKFELETEFEEKVKKMDDELFEEQMKGEE